MAKQKLVSRPTETIRFTNKREWMLTENGYDRALEILGLRWEVEAAHIVPHSSNGKDDILNGLALCRMHHWAFDVGWFALEDNFHILPSRKIHDLSTDFGRMWNYDFMRELLKENRIISLPEKQNIHPHSNAIKWHRENIFYP